MITGFVIFIFVISLSSASFSDWFNKITGRATSDTTTLNITISNSAPAITTVNSISAVTPSESITVNVIFNFTAYDGNGASQLQDSGAQARFQRSGESTRTNTTCINATGTFATNYKNYTCTVGMWYFDQNGAWTVNVTINDSSNSRAENSTTTFTYNTLNAMVMSPRALSWPSLQVTSTNTGSSNDPLLLNNTGNVNTTVNVTAYDLHGETTGTLVIFAANMSINNTDAAGATLLNTTTKNIFGANLPRGNNSLNYGNETSGQEQLYFYVNSLNPDLTSQAYSSTAAGAWSVAVFA